MLNFGVSSGGVYPAAGVSWANVVGTKRAAIAAAAKSFVFINESLLRIGRGCYGAEKESTCNTCKFEVKQDGLRVRRRERPLGKRWLTPSHSKSNWRRGLGVGSTLRRPLPCG